VLNQENHQHRLPRVEGAERLAVSGWKWKVGRPEGMGSPRDGGRCLLESSRSSWATLHAVSVSVAVQNKPGDFHHPIWREFGTMIMGVCLEEKGEGDRNARHLLRKQINAKNHPLSPI